MARNHQPRNDVKRAEQANRALELRRDGLSHRAIAAKMGLALSHAQKLLAEGLAAIPAENAEAVRKLELERLDQLWEKLMTHSGLAGWMPGDDHDERPAIVSAAVRVLERRAKLLGLDAPTKVDATVATKPIEQWSIAELEAKAAEGKGT